MSQKAALSDRDIEVLYELPTDSFVRPMDVGGTNKSHHSATLRRLVSCGLVEQKRHFVGVSGGHWRYRRVDMMREAVQHVKVLAGYECAGLGDELCGNCGPCEAAKFLNRWGLQ